MSKNLNNVRMVLTSPQTVTSDILDKLASMAESIGTIDIQGTATINGCYADTLATLQEKVPNFVITNLGGNFLRITDQAAKSILVTKYDSDGDGEIVSADVINVTDLQSTFKGSAITNADFIVYFPNLTTLSGGKGVSAFYGCTSLKTAKFPVYSTMLYFGNTAGSNSGVFSGCSSLEEIDTTNWNTSNVRSFSYAFNGCKKLKSLGNIDVTSQCTAISYMFQNCNELESVDVSGWNVSNISSFTAVFSGCKKLSIIDTSNWHASSSYYDSMFYDCNSVEELDCSHFNTSNATILYRMFQSCSSLKRVIGAENFDVSKATNMSGMFQSTAIEDFSFLKNWNVLPTANLQQFVSFVKSGADIDLSSWSIETSFTMASFFQDSILNNVSIKGWNTNSSTSFAYFCLRSTINELDIRGISTASATRIDSMFNSAKIKVLRISGSLFDCANRSSSPLSMDGVFPNNCTDLHIYGSITALPNNLLSNSRSTLNNIYIHDETVPPSYGSSLSTSGLNSSCKIYVPYQSVDAYKTAWPDYADMIEGFANYVEDGLE